MLPRPSQGLSPAVESLGLGSALSSQVKDETDDERKKRLREMQERSMMGDTGSAAAFSLLGGGRGTGL